MEIERKWLFKSIAAPKGTKILGEYFYKQAYISINPEVRIRSRRKADEDNFTYALCIKSKGTLERIEVQKELTEKEFYELMVVGNIKEEDFIEKHFYKYSVNNHELTLGVTDIGRSTEFFYGEIEFNSSEDAVLFTPPKWFGEEVTHDPQYKMSNFWEKTRIKSK